MSDVETVVPGQMPWPADLYEPHEAIVNEFGDCLGCGLDALALCHIDVGIPDTVLECPPTRGLLRIA